MRVVSKYSISGSYEVLDESPKYYIVRDAAGRSIALDKQKWEPVQEWVNVTHLCNLHNETDKYIWFGYKNQVCGHYNNQNTRIVVNEHGEVSVEVKQ